MIRQLYNFCFAPCVSTWNKFNILPKFVAYYYLPNIGGNYAIPVKGSRLAANLFWLVWRLETI